MRVLALALVALALAGCAGDSGSSTVATAPPATDAEASTGPAVGAPAEDSLLAAASGATAAAGSYKIDLALERDGHEGPMAMTGTGAFQTDPQRGHVTLELPATGRNEGSGTSEVVIDGQIFYMQIPSFERWIKIDPAAQGGEQAAALGNFAGASQSDPAAALLLLRGASGEPEELGRETVRDAETTHYRLLVDLEQAAQNAGTEAERNAILQSIDTGGVREVPTEVWVDDEGLVRKLQMHYDSLTVGQGETATMTVTIELYDFGAPVAIETPPANQVVDVSELFGGGNP